MSSNMSSTEAALFRRLYRLMAGVAKTHGRLNRRILKIIERLRRATTRCVCYLMPGNSRYWGVNGMPGPVGSFSAVGRWINAVGRWINKANNLCLRNALSDVRCGQ